MIPWFDGRRIELGVPGTGAAVQAPTFVVLVVTGCLIGLLVLQRRLRREGVDPATANGFYVAVIGSAMLSAHVLNGVLYDPEFFDRAMAMLTGEAPLAWPFHGLSSMGGFAGAVLGAALWARQTRRPLATFADAAAFAFPFGWAFGRLGCFLVHDHPGSPTGFFLGVDPYRVGEPPFVARHDLGLYELGWAVALAAAFWATRRRRGPPLAHVQALVLTYAPTRFLLDFLRAEDLPGSDPRLWGLTPAQHLCIFGTALFVGGFVRRRRLDLDGGRG